MARYIVPLVLVLSLFNFRLVLDMLLFLLLRGPPDRTHKPHPPHDPLIDREERPRDRMRVLVLLLSPLFYFLQVPNLLFSVFSFHLAVYVLNWLLDDTQDDLRISLSAGMLQQPPLPLTSDPF